MGLRDFPVALRPLDPGMEDRLDQAVAAGSTQAGLAFTTGRLGGEANYLGAQEATLRAQGRDPEADKLRQDIGALQRRASIYAPAEQDVTQLGWNPGRIVDWTSAQVGQGAASMLDPIGVAAGAGVAARLAPAPLRAAARVAQLAAPFLVNQRQQTGETYNAMVEDPALMARSTPQERFELANRVGAAQSLLDTALPAAVGSRLAGNRLTSVVRGLGPRTAAGKLGLDVLGEGVTEAAQQRMQQEALGQLNPERDVSGDTNELVNAFAGGMAGAGPISAVSHVVGRGHDVVNDAAGKAADGLGKAAEAGSGMAKVAQKLFGRGKEKLDGISLDTGEKITSALAGAKDAVGRTKQAFDDAELLQPPPYGMPEGLDPNSPEWIQAVTDRDAKREARVMELLAERTDDPKAQEFLKTITSPAAGPGLDPYQAKVQAVDDAADYLRGDMAVARTARAAGRAASRAVDLAKRVGATVRDAATGAKEGYAKGRKFNAQGTTFETLPYEQWLSGRDEMRREMTTAERSARADAERVPDSGPSYAGSNLTDLGAGADKANRAAAGARANRQARIAQRGEGLDSTAWLDGEKADRHVVERQDTKRREAVAAEAARRQEIMSRDAPVADVTAKYLGDTASKRQPNVRDVRALARELAYELTSLDAGFAYKAPGKGAVRAVAGEGKGKFAARAQAARAAETPDMIPTVRLNRIAEKFADLYGDQALQEWENVRGIQAKRGIATPKLDYVGQQIQQRVQDPGGVLLRQRQEHEQLASDLVNMIPPEAEAKLLDQGINLRDENGRNNLVTAIQSFANGDGVEDPVAVRKHLDSLFGREAVTAMLERATGDKFQEEQELVMDQELGDAEDSGMDGGTELRQRFDDDEGEKVKIRKDSWEARLAEKAHNRDPGVPKYTFKSGAERYAYGDKPQRWFDDNLKFIHKDDTAQVFKDGKPVMGSDGKPVTTPLPRFALDKELEAAGPNYNARLVSAGDFLKTHGIKDIAILHHVGITPAEMNKAMAKVVTPEVAEARKDIRARIDKWKSENFVVRTERIAPAHDTTMDNVEANMLVMQGRKAFANARRLMNETQKEGKPESEVRKAFYEELDRRNVLIFPREDGSELPIQAGSLATWGMKRLSQSGTEYEGSAQKRNEGFLAGLQEGMVALMASNKHISELPYRYSPTGERQSFQDDIPSSLMLATDRYSALRDKLEEARQEEELKRWRADKALRDNIRLEGLEMGYRGDELNEFIERQLEARHDEDVAREHKNDLGDRNGRVYTSAAQADKNEMAGVPDADGNFPQFGDEGSTPLREAGFVRETRNGPYHPADAKAAFNEKRRAKPMFDGLSEAGRTVATGRQGRAAKVAEAERRVLPRRFTDSLEGHTNALQRRLAPGEAREPTKAVPEFVRKAQERRAAGLLEEAERIFTHLSKHQMDGLISDNVDLGSGVTAFQEKPGVYRVEDKDHNVIARTPAPEVAGEAPGKTQSGPSGAASAKRKYNAQAIRLHNELKRPGFAAAHNSPIKHDGKFNWRKHLGKGEGAWVYGAGTYLSTDDNVHKFYKKKFTGSQDEGLTVDGKPVRTPWVMDETYDKLSDAERYVVHVLHDSTLRGEELRQAAIDTARLTAEVNFSDAVHTLIDNLSEDGRSVLAERIEQLSGVWRDELTGERSIDIAKTDPAALLKLAEQHRLGSAARYAEALLALPEVEEQIRALDLNRFKVDARPSPTYEVSVDIPSERIMDWSAPLSEQPASIRLRALKAIKELGIEEPLSALRGEDLYREVKQHFDTVINKERMEGKTATDPSARASDYLQSLGILGHSYKSNSRSGLPNYVIYDDSKIHTNFVSLNRERLRNNVATDEEVQEAREYIEKVLGGRIKVEFGDIEAAMANGTKVRMSGEYIDADKVIRISTAAGPGVLSTAYHEAMHGLWADLGRMPEVRQLLTNVTDNPAILNRIRALLAKSPLAQEQLGDAEERVAYAYQFWAAGMLDVGRTASGFFAKIQKFLRRIFGLITQEERAAAIFQAFHDGKLAEPSAAGIAIAEVMKLGTWPERARKTFDAQLQTLIRYTFPAHTVLAGSESEAARKLAKQLFNPPGGDEAGEGMLNAQKRWTERFINEVADTLRGLNDYDMRKVEDYLQGGVENLDSIPFTPHREAVARIRKMFARFHEYAEGSGLQLGKVKNYYPRVWDLQVLHDRKADFTKLLTTKYAPVLEKALATARMQDKLGDTSLPTTPEEMAERMWSSLADKAGVEDKLDATREDGVLTPYFQASDERHFTWLEDADIKGFMEKNLIRRLTQYFRQGVRAVEYTRRFGVGGKELSRMLDRQLVIQDNKPVWVPGQIEQELLDTSPKDADGRPDTAWVARRMKGVRQAVGAMEGTLGKDISPTWRKTTSWIMVYQNLRLLPLALFSAVIDPLGMMARGGSADDAYRGFVRGMRDVVRGWKSAITGLPEQDQRDEMERLAEMIGTVSSQHMLDTMGQAYTSAYLDNNARKVNNAMFVGNGMEAWNRAMRVQATGAAVRFIEQHAKGIDPLHSERWLRELGLDADNVPLDQNGRLITTVSELLRATGGKQTEADVRAAKEWMDKVHGAIARWVDGAILAPNSAQRPGWASDPHYSFMFHLKQFTYSFQQTLLRRAVREAGYGNLGPVAALSWGIPMMITSDIVKGLLQGGGELPAYMKSWNLGDWLIHGWQRAGGAGVAQLGIDATHDPSTVLGPMVEQVADAVQDPIGQTVTRAVPLNPLVKGAITNLGA